SARQQRRVELPERGLARTDGGQVVAVDDRVVRRLVQRLARGGRHLVERRQPRAVDGRAPTGHPRGAVLLAQEGAGGLVLPLRLRERGERVGGAGEGGHHVAGEVAGAGL